MDTMLEPLGCNFSLKRWFLLCTVIIFLGSQKMLLANTGYSGWLKNKQNANFTLICMRSFWQHYEQHDTHALASTLTLISTSTILNVKVMHLDVLHRAPTKITAKYVTELIKLLPLLARKNNCSTSFLMHVSHCEIILLSLCNLVRGS